MSHVTHCNDSVKVIAVSSSYHVHINQLEKLIGFAIKMAGNQLIYLVAFRNQTQQQLLAPMQQVLIYLLLNLPICKPGIKTHTDETQFNGSLCILKIYTKACM